MKLSNHEEYGLRCLLRLAEQGPGGSLTIPPDQPFGRCVESVRGEASANAPPGRVRQSHSWQDRRLCPGAAG